MSKDENSSSFLNVVFGLTSNSLLRTSYRRTLVDKLVHVTVTTGGISVGIAIVVVLIYLIWMVVPIFVPSSVKHVHSMPFDARDVLLATTDARKQSIATVTGSGNILFLDSRSLELKAETSLQKGSFTDVKPILARADAFAATTKSNKLIFFRVDSVIDPQGTARAFDNRAELLFDGSEIAFEGEVMDFDVHQDKHNLRIAVATATGKGTLREYRNIDDNLHLSEFHEEKFALAPHTDRMLFGPEARTLYELSESDGSYRILDIKSIEDAQEARQGRFAPVENRVITIAPVLGRNSLLVSDDSKKLSQWSLQAGSSGPGFIKIREFSFDEVIRSIESERHRKGFVALGQKGTGFLCHTTSNAILATFSISEASGLTMLSPTGDQLTIFGADQADVYTIDNEHPELSFKTLFGRVWYEGYPEPTRHWQSSSADLVYEAKYSLVPLLLGTLKTAFFAMLFGIPLAVLGAIYTAVFMTPRMRRVIKPTVEMLESLPTVVIGFIAGLWLAPIVETKLTSILLLVLLLPLSIIFFGFCFSLLPNMLKNRIERWRELACIPIVIGVSYLAIVWDTELSLLLFGTDPRHWLYEVAGIEYEQRNAFIIGIAMGLAIVPTIFSIAEDAIHNVPRQLVHASVALGATRWQTLVRVVLVVASGGIFTAVMIGLSKAVGETMIVLLASGNTPILDFNPFEGMRTMTASIAIELPETQVGSTHFRILTLLALVLFAMTFLFNSLAETARRRWRQHYARL